jgi:hypothetical protein
MSQPGPPPPPFNPAPASAGYGQPVAPAPVNPLAIVSLVAGGVSGLMLLSSTFPFNFMGAFGAVVAVILGHVALAMISRRRYERGRGLAIAGLVLGYCGIVSILFWIVFAAVVILGLASANL